jgi:hypothetical protein
MNWLQIAALVLGEAETLIPIFIHNPQTQKVEAVVVTSLSHVLDQLAQQQAARPVQAAKP